ncbi:MAG: hypothetical protein F4Z36_00530 [Acidimicrobiia bacterium]|nr:hypothetical protein [bacterium]MCY3652219.1 hypothetical protein [bacterium]MDE0643425.1 hypothetical protein [bacterium]MXX63566.1 hypothetical protein [Acidimicrobiia bacterium]
MSSDEGMAFARLFAKRRAELNVSTVDIADLTKRPIQVVVGWEQGSSVPRDDELAVLSEALRLPISLMEEALRRVGEHEKPVGSAGSDSLSDEALYDVEIVPLEESVEDPVIDSLDVEPNGSAWSKLKLRAGRVFGPRDRSTPAQERDPARSSSYMEDPEQQITYRLRMVFSAAGIAILVLVLRWALGGFWAAVTDLWSSLTGVL